DLRSQGERRCRSHRRSQPRHGRAHHAGDRRRQPPAGARREPGMRWSWIFVALLLISEPAGAQSLEERMRSAAAAYERKDFAAAIAVWRPLAEAGNAEAETLLGAMYWSGEGVPRDHKLAARWYLRA